MPVFKINESSFLYAAMGRERPPLAGGVVGTRICIIIKSYTSIQVGRLVEKHHVIGPVEFLL